MFCRVGANPLLSQRPWIPKLFFIQLAGILHTTGASKLLFFSPYYVREISITEKPHFILRPLQGMAKAHERLFDYYDMRVIFFLCR